MSLLCSPLVAQDGVTGGLFLSGLAKWGADELSKQKIVQDFSKKTGVQAHDVGNVITISGAMLSLSLIVNKDTAQELQNLSWRAPIAAGVAGIVCTNTFQNIVKHVPVIRSCISCISCENKSCEGLCSNCKLTKITLAIGVYRAVDVGLQVLPSWLSQLGKE